MAITIDRPSSGRGHFDIRELHSAPERSMQQRLTALEHANEVRGQRARLKRDIAGGRQPIAALLLNPPAWAEDMKVMDVLLAVRSYGRVKTVKILRCCEISSSKTIGGLTERQRLALVTLLRRAGR